MGHLVKPRKKRVLLVDVAHEADVSVATASMALNDRNGVSAQTRRRVEDAASKLGYTGFKRAMGHCIGVWVPPVPSHSGEIHFQSMLLRGISLACGDHGYQLVYITTEVGRYQDPIPLPEILTLEMDGIIILAATRAHLTRTGNFHGPVVLVDSYRQFPFIAAVDNDDEGGAYTATSHLLKMGHASIAYIGAKGAHGEQTWRGFRRALMEAKKVIHPCLVEDVPWGADNGYQAMKTIIGRGQLPTALFCGGDELAYGGIRALQEHGLSVPEDIAVVAMDDLSFSENLNPPLSTVHIPIEEMGKEAVELLVKILSKEAPLDSQVILQNQLIIRKSCGAT